MTSGCRLHGTDRNISNGIIQQNLCSRRNKINENINTKTKPWYEDTPNTHIVYGFRPLKNEYVKSATRRNKYYVRKVQPAYDNCSKDDLLVVYTVLV